MTPEDTPAIPWDHWPIYWVELKNGRLRNWSTDPECVEWAHQFYEHPVGTARSVGYNGA